MKADIAIRVILASLVTLGVSGQPLRPSHGSAAIVFPKNSRVPIPTIKRNNYVGDDACSSCHGEKVRTFHNTAHYVSSRLPNEDSILGSFAPGASILKTSVPDLYFEMERSETGFFQTAVQGIAPHVESRRERFGLVIGSGGKGQTYLYWKGDQLFELPISYWREVGWVNSPGYADGDADFDRPIVPRCLECHATYFEPVSNAVNRYRLSSFILGITCEKCHGPGSTHVQRENSRVRVASGSGILNPARFSRDRQIDLCAWCHGGRGTAIAAAFSYIPGEPLTKYLKLHAFDPNAPVDVHGDQVDLLRKSRCFQSSGMTCFTCHNVHTAEHDLQAFSQRCLTCHKPGTGAFPASGHQAASNCIDCHMVKQDTNLIVFDWKGNKKRPQVRTHWIKNYAEKTTASAAAENSAGADRSSDPLR